ncbi:aminotransferase class IV [Micromonospora sp. WMMD1128]|uniref:aminotransferase class IV n=1 Tax=Micromonospora sp. WMMD1128 TaxID=3015150 RepID=UPI00248C4C74|nr:aminotransferase class IV [Micromonospora sp. WMMD1128]WBB73854.1 aminotransferase class IV [Micromonospora sp. WMMD1128]
MELDGAPVSPADLSVLALVNYGHFTTMRVAGGRVRGLAHHLERLRRDSRTLFGAELDPERVRFLARRMITGPAGVDGGGAVAVRVTAFDSRPGLDRPPAPAAPRLLVTVRPAPAGPLPPLALRSVRYVRELPEVKHTGLWAAVHHRRAAQAAGFDDALFVAEDGRVVEGSTWNLAVVRGETVIWPDAPCLPGVTMRLLGDALDRLGIAHRTGRVELTELNGETAVFTTNATAGLRPVAAVDGVPLARADELVAALRREYDAIAGEPL